MKIHSAESQEFIRKLREKSPKPGEKAKTDAMLVRKHQNAHGGGIIWGILLMVMSCFNLYDDVGNNRFYFGILMMVLGIVQLIYSIRKFRKGDIFRKEWIAHWRKVKKDVRNLSFDELNDMARWL